MANLIDILNNVPQRNQLGNLDTGVIEALHGLSEIIESDIGNDESRLSEYQDGIQDFVSGLEDGYQQRTDGVYDEPTPYSHGHIIGYSIKNEILERGESQNDSQVISYQNLYEQLRHVAHLIDTELEGLIQALKDPYNFLLTQLPAGEGMDKMDKSIDEGLVKILDSYRDLTQDLLNKALDEDFVKQLEGKKEKTFKDQVQLGIVYMFRGNFIGAQEQFYEAKNKAPSNDLNSALRDVAGNITTANSILMSAYSRIKLAQDFERAVPQYSQP